MQSFLLAPVVTLTFSAATNAIVNPINASMIGTFGLTTPSVAETKRDAMSQGEAGNQIYYLTHAAAEQ